MTRIHTRLLPALAGLLLLLLAGGQALAGPVTATVVRDDPDRIVIRYDIHSFDLVPVNIGSSSYVKVKLGEESPLKQAGAPELPTIDRSIIIPDDAEMAVKILSSHYRDVEHLDVAPSKGILYRSVDPASVPYSFGPAYSTNAFFPGPLASLREPYILRDYRGLVVEIAPFQYNPVTRTLRAYDQIIVEVSKIGPGTHNVLTLAPRGSSLAFHQISKHHFLNYQTRSRYSPLSESGELLIIAHDAWLPNLQPFVAHKSSIGIPTTAVGVSTIGNDPSSIGAYISSAYTSGNLAFVLLVGDVAQVASPYASGGVSDPSYAKVAGSDDYPDIIVGRFSAETPADVDTQVQRTIEYENLPATEQPWFKKGTGIGSNEGPGDDGEMDYQHTDNIRLDLLGYGYTEVDQLNDPGVQASAVAAALNAGRGIVSYTGHGSLDSWVTSGFNNSNIQSLTNTGMLPFITSVACNNGEFNSGTCFGEAWLRARTATGEPIGAIGIYASSISQSWDPPMAAQDETVDLLVAEQYFSFGALAFAGSCLMMDEYGAGGVEMYDTWHVFGDPTVRVFGTAAPPTGLKVQPFLGLEAQGDPGGPFDPPQQIYTLENHNDTPLAFSAGAAASWITVTPATGTIAAHGTTTVSVSLNSEANAFAMGYYEDTVSFVNETDHDGDTTRHVGLTVGVPHPIYEWPLDDDPGWTTQGGWAFGQPTGNGGFDFGGPDPTSGYTGANVYGYNLQGDYPNDMAEEHLITGAIDCSMIADTSLRFWRWLGVEQPIWDHASIAVSTDGSSWQTVWQNPGEVTDSQWTEQVIDISDIADGQPTVYIRWTQGTSDSIWPACGWNIDDIAIWGLLSCSDADGDGYLPELCGGADCDDDDAAVSPGAAEDCSDTVDNDCDGATDAADTDCQGSGGAGGDGGSDGGTAGAGGDGGDGGDSISPTEPFVVDDPRCSCRLGAKRSTAPALWLILAGLLLLGVRRRRG